MKVIAKTMIAIMVVILGCVTGAHAWDVEYDAVTGLLPTEASPAWQLESYGAPTSIVDGSLHIGNGANGGADYRREVAAIDAGVPVTMETRMRVLSATGGITGVGISTYSGEVHIGIFPDHIMASDRYYNAHTFWHDFTIPHSIRLAYSGDRKAYLWVDDQLAMSWIADIWRLSTGPPQGVSFGSGLSDSYWQYVAYSKEFFPLPEPTSLAALGLGAGWVLMRRRR